MKTKNMFLSIFAIILMALITSGETSLIYGKEKKATKDSKSVVELEKEVKRLNEELSVVRKHNPKNAAPLKMTVTAAVVGKKLHTTALGCKVMPGTCAISQDKAYLVGKWIYVPQLGKMKVSCVMPKSRKNAIDYYTTSVGKAKAIGKSERVVAVL